MIGLWASLYSKRSAQERFEKCTVAIDMVLNTVTIRGLSFERDKEDWLAQM